MTHIQAILRIASTVACGIVIAAFVMWASDEGRANSDQQIARIGQSHEVDPNRALPVADQAPSAVDHGGVRGAIEDANAWLITPFEHVGRDGGEWVAHIAPLVLALLTYGLLARILIAYLPR
jgi:hypothetical protein